MLTALNTTGLESLAKTLLCYKPHEINLKFYNRVAKHYGLSACDERITRYVAQRVWVDRNNKTQKPIAAEYIRKCMISDGLKPYTREWISKRLQHLVNIGALCRIERLPRGWVYGVVRIPDSSNDTPASDVNYVHTDVTNKKESGVLPLDGPLEGPPGNPEEKKKPPLRFKKELLMYISDQYIKPEWIKEWVQDYGADIVHYELAKCYDHLIAKHNSGERRFNGKAFTSYASIWMKNINPAITKHRLQKKELKTDSGDPRANTKPTQKNVAIVAGAADKTPGKKCEPLHKEISTIKVTEHKKRHQTEKLSVLRSESNNFVNFGNLFQGLSQEIDKAQKELEKELKEKNRARKHNEWKKENQR